VPLKGFEPLTLSLEGSYSSIELKKLPININFI
jgi:hypothetical protein